MHLTAFGRYGIVAAAGVLASCDGRLPPPATPPILHDQRWLNSFGFAVSDPHGAVRSGGS